MLRSLKVVGVVALTLGVPSVALGGNSSGSLQAGNTNGQGFETSITVDTPPLNGKCPAVLKIHGTTTLLSPDGKHFTATGQFNLGVGKTTPQPLDFSKHTTVKWESEYTSPDIGSVMKAGISALITDYAGNVSSEVVANAGTFELGCAGTTVGSKPSIPAAVTSTPNICDDYNASTLQINVAPAAVVRPGAYSKSLYIGNQVDVLLAAGVIKHFKSMCTIPATSYFYFEGEGLKNSPDWGKCTPYDNTTVSLVNDATGWLVKAGEKVLFRVPLEADARTLGEAVKHRTNACTIGEGSEPAAHVLKYLH